MKGLAYIKKPVAGLLLWMVTGVLLPAQLPEARLLLRELPLQAMADTLRKEGYAVVVVVAVIGADNKEGGSLRYDYERDQLCRVRWQASFGKKADAQACWEAWLDFAFLHDWVPTELYEYRQEKRCRFMHAGLSIVLQTRMENDAWLSVAEVYWVNKCSLRLLDEIPGRGCWEEEE